jgi:Uma2 family endonuclease
MIGAATIPAKRSQMAELKLSRMTPDEFLAWQEKQDKLYELVDGAPVLPLKMTTGASQGHDRAVVNMIVSLGNQLRGKPCRPTTSDLAVRIPAGNIRRPDVTVECGQAGRRELTVREPRVVIEVLSPSTMSFDRFKKVLEYQTIDTLTHILLVDTEAPQIDVLSRSPNKSWLSTRYEGLDARIELPTIGATLSLVDVFEGLEFAG